MKRKIFTLTLVLCMALTMAVAMPAMADEPIELVVNGGFEGVAGTDGDGNPTTQIFKSDNVTPAGPWRRVDSGYEFTAVPEGGEITTPGLYVIQDATKAHSGNNSLYFHQEDGDRIAIDFVSAPGKTYKISTWMKADNMEAKGEKDTTNNGKNVGKRLRFYANIIGSTTGTYYTKSAPNVSTQLYTWSPLDENGWTNYILHLTVPSADVLGLDATDTTVKIALNIGMTTATNGTTGAQYLGNFYLDDMSIKEYCDGNFAPSATFSETTVTAGAELTVSTEHSQRYLSDTTKTLSGYSLIYAVYSTENGVKRLESVEVEPVDASIQKISSHTAFSGDGKKGDAKEGAFWGISKTTNYTLNIPESTTNGVVKVLVWDGVSLSALGAPSEIGGLAE